MSSSSAEPAPRWHTGRGGGVMAVEAGAWLPGDLVSAKPGTHGLLTPASGGDVAGLCSGWLRRKATHSSSFREELGVLWTSWKTACLLKGGSSYVLAWEICLVVQST